MRIKERVADWVIRKVDRLFPGIIDAEWVFPAIATATLILSLAESALVMPVLIEAAVTAENYVMLPLLCGMTISAAIVGVLILATNLVDLQDCSKITRYIAWKTTKPYRRFRVVCDYRSGLVTELTPDMHFYVVHCEELWYIDFTKIPMGVNINWITFRKCIARDCTVPVSLRDRIKEEAWFDTTQGIKYVHPNELLRF